MLWTAPALHAKHDGHYLQGVLNAAPASSARYRASLRSILLICACNTRPHVPCLNTDRWQPCLGKHGPKVQFGVLVCITSSWLSSSSGTKPLPPQVGHCCSSSVPFSMTPSPLQSGQVFKCEPHSHARDYLRCRLVPGTYRALVPLHPAGRHRPGSPRLRPRPPTIPSQPSSITGAAGTIIEQNFLGDSKADRTLFTGRRYEHWTVLGFSLLPKGRGLGSGRHHAWPFCLAHFGSLNSYLR
jgi:hypothetical protein